MAIASTIMLVGILMIVSGHGVLGIIAGIAIIVFGLVVLFNPLATIVAMPIAAGFLSIVAGIAIIARAFRPRSAEPA